MRLLLIAGSRGIRVGQMIHRLRRLERSTLVCGMCPDGADAIAWGWWMRKKNGLIFPFPADWDKYGKSAGMKRNIQMGEFCTDAEIWWDGESSGTKNMIQILAVLRKPTIVYCRDRRLVYKIIDRHKARMIVRPFEPRTPRPFKKTP